MNDGRRSPLGCRAELWLLVIACVLACSFPITWQAEAADAGIDGLTTKLGVDLGHGVKADIKHIAQDLGSVANPRLWDVISPGEDIDPQQQRHQQGQHSAAVSYDECARGAPDSNQHGSRGSTWHKITTALTAPVARLLGGTPGSDATSDADAFQREVHVAFQKAVVKIEEARKAAAALGGAAEGDRESSYDAVLKAVAEAEKTVRDYGHYLLSHSRPEALEGSVFDTATLQQVVDKLREVLPEEEDATVVMDALHLEVRRPPHHPPSGSELPGAREQGPAAKEVGAGGGVLDKIKEKLHLGARHAGEAAEGLADKTEEAAQKGKAVAGEAIEEGKAAAGETGDRAKRRAEQAVESGKQAADELAGKAGAKIETAKHTAGESLLEAEQALLQPVVGAANTTREALRAAWGRIHNVTDHLRSLLTSAGEKAAATEGAAEDRFAAARSSTLGALDHLQDLATDMLRRAKRGLVQPLQRLQHRAPAPSKPADDAAADAIARARSALPSATDLTAAADGVLRNMTQALSSLAPSSHFTAPFQKLSAARDMLQEAIRRHTTSAETPSETSHAAWRSALEQVSGALSSVWESIASLAPEQPLGTEASAKLQARLAELRQKGPAGAVKTAYEQLAELVEGAAEVLKDFDTKVWLRAREEQQQLKHTGEKVQQKVSRLLRPADKITRQDAQTPVEALRSFVSQTGAALKRSVGVGGKPSKEAAAKADAEERLQAAQAVMQQLKGLAKRTLLGTVPKEDAHSAAHALIELDQSLTEAAQQIAQAQDNIHHLAAYIISTEARLAAAENAAAAAKSHSGLGHSFQHAVQGATDTAADGVGHLQRSAQAVVETLSNGVENVRQGLTGAATAVHGGAQGLRQGVQDAVRGGAENVKQGAQGAAGALHDVADNVSRGVHGAASSLHDSAQELKHGVQHAAQGGAQNVKHGVQGAARAVQEGAESVQQGVLDSPVVHAVLGAPAAVGDSLRMATDRAHYVVHEAQHAAGEAAAGAAATVRGGAEQVLNGVTGAAAALQQGARQLLNTAAGAAAGAVDSVKAAPAKVGDALEVGREQVVGTVHDAAAAAAERARAVADGAQYGAGYVVGAAQEAAAGAVGGINHAAEAVGQQVRAGKDTVVGTASAAANAVTGTAASAAHAAGSAAHAAGSAARHAAADVVYAGAEGIKRTAEAVELGAEHVEHAAERVQDKTGHDKRWTAHHDHVGKHREGQHGNGAAGGADMRGAAQEYAQMKQHATLPLGQGGAHEGGAHQELHTAADATAQQVKDGLAHARDGAAEAGHRVVEGAHRAAQAVEQRQDRYAKAAEHSAQHAKDQVSDAAATAKDAADAAVQRGKDAAAATAEKGGDMAADVADSGRRWGQELANGFNGLKDRLQSAFQQDSNEATASPKDYAHQDIMARV